MRIGICEPNSEYMNYLSGLLSQIRSINGAAIIPYLNSKWFVSDLSLCMEAFDILLINREMDGYNGAYVAREAVRINPSCQVILISEVNRFLDEDYDIPQLLFLPKEHVPLRLVTVIDRAVKLLRQKNEHYFYVQSNRERILIPCSKVHYMEKMLRKTELITSDNRISTYQIPSELIENANTENFVQCHRSFFVNLEYIFSIGTSEITLQSGEHLPIGSTFSKSFIKHYESYCACLLNPIL